MGGFVTHVCQGCASQKIDRTKDNLQILIDQRRPRPALFMEELSDDEWIEGSWQFAASASLQKFGDFCDVICARYVMRWLGGPFIDDGIRMALLAHICCKVCQCVLEYSSQTPLIAFRSRGVAKERIRVLSVDGSPDKGTEGLTDLQKIPSLLLCRSS